MRPLFMFNMLTLDGFFEGPHADISWHVVDEDFDDFANEQLNTIDLILFGRVTYEMMAGYWPTSQAIQENQETAKAMNSIAKVVFSKSAIKAEWNNTRLVTGDAVEEVRRLKAQAGGKIALFGSADLASTLTAAGLIDEYRLMINPVVLGQGSPLFKSHNGKMNFTLLSSRVFKSGDVLLVYKPLK